MGQPKNCLSLNSSKLSDFKNILQRTITYFWFILWLCCLFLFLLRLNLHNVPSRISMQFRVRIFGRNWDKILKTFPPCYSQSPLLSIFHSHLWFSWTWDFYSLDLRFIKEENLIENYTPPLPPMVSEIHKKSTNEENSSLFIKSLL